MLRRSARWLTIALATILTTSASREVSEAANETVLLVTGSTPSAGDLAIQTRLQATLGLTVVTESGAATAGSHASGKALVLISSSALASDVGTKFQSVATPVLTWNSAVMPNMNMTGPGTPLPNVDFGTAAHFSEVVIANEAHPMAAGLTGTVAVTTTPGNFTWGWSTAASAIKIATLGVATNRLAVFGYEEGKPLVTGTAPKRRVGFFLTSDTATQFILDGSGNGPGWALFEAAVNWAKKVNLAPSIANLAASYVVSHPRDILELVALVDDDGQPEPPALTYQWTQPATGCGTPLTIQSPTDAGTAVTFTQSGTYCVHFEARDGLAISAKDIGITVNLTDRAPEFLGPITATPSSTVILGSSITLSASVYDEGLAAPLKYQWSKLSGPASGVVTFGTATAATTTASFSVKGDYEIQLLVWDGGLSTPSGNISPASIVISSRAQALLVVNSAVQPPTDASMSAGDRALRDRLVSLGFSTTPLRDASASSTGTEALGKQVVVISGSVVDNNVLVKFKNRAEPVVLLKSTLFDNMALTGTASTEFGTQTSQTAVTIALATDQRAAGYSGNVAFEPATNPQTIGWGKPAIAGVKVATLTTDSTKATVFGYAAGTMMAQSFTAPGRRVGFFALDAAVPGLTTEGWRLLDAAISWGSTNNLAPVVSAGSDATYDSLSLPLNTVPLAGTVLDDNYPPAPPGLTSIWTLTSSPTLPPGLEPVIQNPAAASTTVALKAAGFYVFRLTASDGDLSSSDEVLISVVTPNQPPTVYSGNDQTVNIPTAGATALATLTGSYSDDGLPNPPAAVALTWSQVDGPAAATITSPTALVTNVTIPIGGGGTYVFRLTASDGGAPPVSDDVVVTATTPALLIVGVLDGSGTTVSTAGDQVLKDRLEALKYAVVVKNSTAVVADTTGKAVVVIAPTADPVAIGTKFRNTLVPFVVARHDLLDDMGLTAANAFGTVPAQTKVGVVAPTEVLAAGLTGTPTVASSSTFTWGTRAGGLVTVASIAGDSTKATILKYEAGATLAAGTPTTVNARRVGLFLKGQGATNLDANGRALLDAAISWAAKINRPPRVNAGLDQSLYWAPGATQVVATLTATATDDGLPNPPAALSFVPGWTKLSGPGNAAFSAPTSASTTVTIDAPGEYEVRVAVRDGSTSSNGLTSTDDVHISVSTATNQPPTVSAGPDVSVVLPSSADLNGWAYDDGRPGALTLTWSRVSGPGSVTFTSPATAATTATFDAAGVYRLRLTAFDGAIAASADMYVTAVANALLVTQTSTLTADENAIMTRLQGLGAFNSVTTIAAASSDASSADAQSLVVISPSVVATDVNTKFKTVAVPVLTMPNALYDDMGMTGTTSGTHFGSTASQTTTTISATGHPLSAGLTLTPTVTTSSTYSWGTPGTASGSTKAATIASNSARATIFGYEKATVMPGATAPARRVAFGLLPSTLNVNGQLLFDAAIRWVASINAPPRVNAGVDKTITLPATASLSDALAFDDGLPSPPGAMTKTWTAVAGPGGVWFDDASLVNTVAHFTVAGDYILQLTASDGLLTRWDQVAVTVIPAPPNALPTANAGPDMQVTLPQPSTYGPLVLKGVVSDDGLPTPTLTISWTKILGPGNVVFTPSTSAQTSVTFSATGIYVLRLTVTDGGQLSASDDVTITVLPRRSALMVVPNATLNPLSPGDAAIKARLTGLGFTVTAAADNNASLTSLATALVTSDAPPAPLKNLVVVTNVDATLVGTKLRTVAVPTIVTKATLYPDMGMADSAIPGVDFGEEVGQTQVVINNESLPLSARLQGTVTLTTAPATFGFADGLIDEWKAAWQPSGDQGMVFGYEQGVTMLAALDAPARRVGFPTAAGDLFTADGWRMFDAAVTWASERVVPALFVSGAATNADQRVQRRLDALGFAAVIKSDSAVTAADANGKALIVISRSVNAATLGTKLQAASVPVITFDPDNFFSMGMTGGVSGDDYGATPNQTEVAILKPTHPLAAHLSGQRVPVLTAANGDFGWAMPNAAATKVAVVVGYSYGATVFAYEKGAVMPGLVAPARRIGLYMNEVSIVQFTDNGFALLDAAIRWAGDADPDKDGLSTFNEFKLGTDPNNADTNGDGVLDGAQAYANGGATNTDMDGDGLSNAVELQKGTDPFNRDTDGDGALDGVDCFPLDPMRSGTCPAGNGTDHTAPLITLLEPTNTSPFP